MKIVFPEKIYMLEDSEYLPQLQEMGVKFYSDIPDTEAETINRIKNAEVISATNIEVTPSVIDAAPSLKFIIVPAVGYDWVDVKYAKTKGVTVVNCPTHNSPAVAELAITLMFAAARRVSEAHTGLRSGLWQSTKYVGVELRGKKLGLVGYGNIGKNIETLAKGLGMEVNHVNSKSSAGELDTLLKSSDVVCVCAALNESTKGMLDSKRLGLLKASAIFINVSRGAIVDQEALMNALKNNKIMAAGLDVFVGEPAAGVGEPTKEIIELAKLSNVVATPHIGYNTVETNKRVGKEILDNLEAILAGQPINVVN